LFQNRIHPFQIATAAIVESTFDTLNQNVYTVNVSDLREKILACALDQYLDQGLKGLSMRKIAEKLEVSATAIYRHYRNKEDLLNNIIGEAIKVFGNYLFASLAGKTPEERLNLGGEAYINFALEQRNYYEVIFLAPDQLGQECMPEDLRNKSMATFQFLIDRVQECMESGHIKKNDPYSVAMTIWAHSHGLISIYLAGKSPLDEAGFRKLYWESHSRIMNGLGTQK
jgi:AcrR family transcriptional regulator